MSEEEKEAIEYLENQDNSVNWNYPTLQAILGALNLIDKLQKENEELKNYEYIKALLQQAHDLKGRIKELEEENAELKEELDYYKQKENQDFEERDYYEE